MTMAISEEDLRGLSAAEQEALRGLDDDEDVTLELGANVASADADDGAEDEAPAAVDAKEGKPASTDEKPAEAQDATTVAATDGVADDEADEVPAPRRLTPADAGAQRQTLRAERADALQKLMDGEMTPEDFQKTDGEVQDKLDALVRAEASDQARAQINYDAMMQEYSREMQAMQKDLRAAGLDISAVGVEFDRAIRLFAQDAEARGLIDRPGNIEASKAALQDARDLLLRRHNKAAPAATPAAAPAAPKEEAQRKPKPVDRSKFPPTLANVPVAADASVAGEFAHLEGLEGSALERAIAKLSPEQQDRYLD